MNELETIDRTVPFKCYVGSIVRNTAQSSVFHTQKTNINEGIAMAYLNCYC